MSIILSGKIPSSTTTQIYEFIVDGEPFSLGITHPALVVLAPPVGAATNAQIEAIGRIKIEIETQKMGKRPQSEIIIRTEDVDEIREHLQKKNTSGD